MLRSNKKRRDLQKSRSSKKTLLKRKQLRLKESHKKNTWTYAYRVITVKNSKRWKIQCITGKQPRENR